VLLLTVAGDNAGDSVGPLRMDLNYGVTGVALSA